MTVSLAEKLAAEYVRLIQEGWDPDLDEFLGRVPNQYRADCRLYIEQRLAASDEAEPEEAEPVADELLEEPVAVEEVEEFVEEADESGELDDVIEFSLFDGVAVRAEPAEEVEAYDAVEEDELEELDELEGIEALEALEVLEEPADFALVEEAEANDEAEEPAPFVEPEPETADEIGEMDPPKPVVVSAADELRSFAADLEHEAEQAVDECVSVLADAVGAGEPGEVAEEEEPVEQVSEETVAFDTLAGVEATADEEPAEEAHEEKPKGPQRLSKAEAMAMWDSQLARVR